MKSSLAIALSLLGASLVSAAPAVADSDAYVRVNGVREFVQETGNTVLVRQARTQYLRISLDSTCPIADARRIGFKVGAGVTYSLVGSTGAAVPVNQGSTTPRIYSDTRHAWLISVNKNETQYICKINQVEHVAPDVFTAAKARTGSADNRLVM